MAVNNTEGDVSKLDSALNKLAAVASNIESIVTNMVRKSKTHSDRIFIVFS